MAIRKIALNTGGGDAPGLNAVIRSAVHSALHRGWECVGIRDGYNGILEPDEYPQNGLIPLTHQSVRGITHLGGTILGTTNRGNPVHYPVRQSDGSYIEINRVDELLGRFREEGIDALVAIGGDGSLKIANAFVEKGFPVVGVPKTIDNDIFGTEVTFGFDSAVSFATECIDRLHSTAEAHHRVMVVEVMGRYAGWIALHAGVAGTADAILIPEIPYSIDKIAAKVQERDARGRHFSIIVVAEGAKPVDGETSIIGKSIGQAERLGGAGERVVKQIEALTGKESRLVVLGHLLRGGAPTTFDRLLSLRFGAAAVRSLAAGMSGVMVGLEASHIHCVPFSEVAGKMRGVPTTSDIILTARDLGITFGD